MTAFNANNPIFSDFRRRKPNKLLGQHFLADKNILRKIIEAAAIKNTDTVLEVGPGRGILTFEIAERAGKVVAVEKDPALADILKNEIGKRDIRNVDLITGDILKIPSGVFARMVPYRAVANIPYYLTARLLRKLLEEVPRPKDILFTVQKEVAERIVSKPPRMNLLALAVQIYGAPKILFTIPKSAFWPAPEVEAAVIKIENISKNIFRESGVSESDFFRIARAAFQTKRKTILNSLGRQTSIDKPSLQNILSSLGIAPLARPGELGKAEWIRLVARLAKKS